MSHSIHAATLTGLRTARWVVLVAATLMSGACAQIGAEPGSMLVGGTETSANADTAEAAPAATGSELDKATAFWGEKHTKEPQNLDAAINYAKNLRAQGNKALAMNVLQTSSLYHGENKKLASEYGRLALELGQIQIAQQVLQIADDPGKPDWRVLSALGTVMAKQDKQDEAVSYYERALALAPDQPSVLNNLAMAYAMKGEAQKGEVMLRRALAKDPGNDRMRQNLALMLSLQGRYDEAKLAGGTGAVSTRTSADVDELRRTLRVEARGQSPIATASTGTGGWDARIMPSR